MDTVTKPPPIPVSLLTGFLGSGKTTVLNHLVQQPLFKRTLVVINELGAISLDHLLVAHSNETLVMEVGDGCICCAMRGDLAKVLKDITWRFSRNGVRNYDRVIIEATGLADPAPILHTLMTDKNISARYRLDAVVTTIDCVHAMDTLDHHPEAVKQAAIADRIVLTKSDLIDEQQRCVLQQRLAILNPAALQFLAVNGQVDGPTVFSANLFSLDQKTPDVVRWLSAEAYAGNPSSRYEFVPHGAAQAFHSLNRSIAKQPDINRHDDHILSYCFTFDEPIDPELFEDWLNLLLTVKGADILRIKGVVNMKNRAGPIVIHGVQHIFHPPVELIGWPSDDRRTRIVFITRNVPRSVIEDTFSALTGCAAFPASAH